MNQQDALNATVNSLRLRFLQNNSHIPDIDQWIDKQVVATIQAIRGCKGNTDELVASIRK